MKITSRWLASIGAVVLLGFSACSGDESTGAAGASTSTGFPSLNDCATLSHGQALTGSASADGQVVTVLLRSTVGAGWKTVPTVSHVAGGTLQKVTLDDGDGTDIFVEIALSAGSMGGSFELTGTMVGYETGKPACDVTRTIWFTLGDAGDAITVT